MLLIRSYTKVKNKLLGYYAGEFEMVGNLKVGDDIRQTHIRFKISNGYEIYINSIEESYDTDDAIFNGYFYKMNTLQFNLVISS